jgi:hypothetical protein
MALGSTTGLTQKGMLVRLFPVVTYSAFPSGLGYTSNSSGGVRGLFRRDSATKDLR